MFNFALAVAGLTAVASASSYFIEEVSATFDLYVPLPAAKNLADAPCVRTDLESEAYGKYVCTDLGSSSSVNKYSFGDDVTCGAGSFNMTPETFAPGDCVVETGYACFACDDDLDYVEFDMWAYDPDLVAAEEDRDCSSNATYEVRATTAINICLPSDVTVMGQSSLFVLYEQLTCNEDGITIEYFLDEGCITPSNTTESIEFGEDCMEYDTVPETEPYDLIFYQEFVACYIDGVEQPPPVPGTTEVSEAVRRAATMVAAVAVAGMALLA